MINTHVDTRQNYTHTAQLQLVHVYIKALSAAAQLAAPYDTKFHESKLLQFQKDIQDP